MVFHIEGCPGEFTGALFDLDDTLIDRRGAFRQWAKDASLRWIDEGANAVSPDEGLEFLIRADNGGFTPRLEFFAAVINKFGLRNLSPAELIDVYYESMVENMSLTPGADRLLRSMELKGYGFGIVTNGSQHQRDKARAAGLEARACTVVVSDDVGSRKPERKIFEVASAQMSLPSQRIVFFGDQLQIDIVGAKHCGMGTVWVSESVPAHVEGTSCVDLQVASLDDVFLSFTGDG